MLCIYFRYSDKMDTRQRSKERAQAQEALAKAKAAEDSEEVSKKRIPITQAKLRRLNAKNRVKTALNQIRDAIEDFEATEDPTSKELAADNIDYGRKSLVEAERELIKATDNLSQVLAEADPTVIESDVFQLTSEIEAEKDKLLEDWKGIRRAHQDIFDSAQSLMGQSRSKEVTIVPNVSSSSVQRKFAPDQNLKPKILSDNADLLEVKDFIKDFKNYIQSGYALGEEVPAGHYRQMRNIMDKSWLDRLDRKDAEKLNLDNLCKILHEEAERKYPKHQRRINMLKMKKFNNESCSEFL